jgi:myo-inositol 2-dehydrogenase/D-chiro-inositol 1-dehydrogenase
MQVDRIVVVGCGSIGRRHARLLSARDDVALELCEPAPENLAAVVKDVGAVPEHRSFQDMLQTKPQMVLVATPDALHADQTIAALNAGAHVLCEKPMSDSLLDAERMLAAARESDRVLDVGFTLHFHPVLQHIKRLIDSGELGQILHVHWHVGAYDTLMSSVTRRQATTYGALLLDYAHQPDLIYWWLGATPRRVYAVGGAGEGLPLLARPNVVSVTLEYDGPLIATINLNYIQHPQHCFCQVVGDRAWVMLDLQANSLQLGWRNESAVQEQSFKFERDDLYRAEHEAFMRSARGARKPESPPEVAIQSMHVVAAAIESLRSRSPAEVPNSN